MAEEFEAGVCSGNWWNNLMMITNPSRTGVGGGGGGFFGSGSSFCSPGNTPSWKVDDVVSNNSSVSEGSAVCFQNDSDSGGSTTTAAGGVLIDSTALQLIGFGGCGVSSSSPSSSDWNQHHQQQQQMSDRMDQGSNYVNNWCNRTAEDPLLNNLSNFGEDHNHFCNIDHLQQPSINDSMAVATTAGTSSYGGYPSSLIQSLFESDVTQPPPPLFSNSMLLNELSSSASASASSWPKFETTNHNSNNNNNSHHFPDLGIGSGAEFWDSSASTTSVSRSIEGIRVGFTKPQQGHAQARFNRPNFEQNTTTCPIIKQPKKEEGSNSKDSRSATKKGSSEPAFKRPRIETPSSLPTFKVRKEKLGDRITALQQLVSPFGKTDTASVLHEAIEYIKFLHDQVSVLSTPYMKNGNPIHQQQQKGTSIADHKLDQEPQIQQDLRTRGLCLVPISSTFPVASETTADFWTPTFGGSFR